MTWSGLPGPAAFFQKLFGKLRDGQSILVGAASNAHPELEEALRERLQHEHFICQSLVYQGTQDPLEFLTNELYLEPDKWVGWDIGQLVELIGSAKIVLVEGVASRWEAWRKFLGQFESASRNLSSSDRPLLVLVARGIPPQQLQLQGAALACLPWSGVVGELDMLMYVDTLLRANGAPRPKYHKLLLRQITALAVWDLPLARRLAALPSRELFEPRKALQACLAHEPANTLGNDWHSGGIEWFDGNELRHPCLLLKADPDKEIERRVWTAQASELFPLIEMRRRELVAPLQRQIRLPTRLNDEALTSLEDVEIGSLAYLAWREKVRPELQEAISRLRNYRNALAQLEILGSNEALDTRLYETRGI